MERPPSLRRPPAKHGPNYRRGGLYALVTAALLALQEPFSALAAQKLHALNFVAFTQVALVLSCPLLLASAAARRDFVAIVARPAHWPKLLALLGVGVAGLLLYDVALSSAHPIVSAAVFNLSPFWAALVARLVTRTPIPKPRAAFLLCFAVAFAGAMCVAFSQIRAPASDVMREIVYTLFHSRWALALPMPIFFALSGTLVYHWFRDFEEGAAIASNFVVSGLALIPAALYASGGSLLPGLGGADAPAIFLLLLGTLASSAAGRLFYQSALTATENDNGLVTMFFLAIPAISAAVSWPLSFWIRPLIWTPSPLFFAGLALVMAPLLAFSIVTLRRRDEEPARAPRQRLARSEPIEDG